MKIKDRHEIFLIELKNLLYKHEVDLVLKQSDYEESAVNLCVLSHGIFTPIASMKFNLTVNKIVHVSL